MALDNPIQYAILWLAVTRKRVCITPLHVTLMLAHSVDRRVWFGCLGLWPDLHFLYVLLLQIALQDSDQLLATGKHIQG